MLEKDPFTCSYNGKLFKIKSYTIHAHNNPIIIKFTTCGFINPSLLKELLRDFSKNMNLKSISDYKFNKQLVIKTRSDLIALVPDESVIYNQTVLSEIDIVGCNLPKLGTLLTLKLPSPVLEGEIWFIKKNLKGDC